MFPGNGNIGWQPQKLVLVRVRVVATFQWQGRWTWLGISSVRGAPFSFFFFLLHLVLPGHGWGLGNVHIISEGCLLGLSFFDVSLCGGRGGLGNFQPWELDESQGDPPHRVWDRAHFLLQLCLSLTFCMCLDLLHDLLGLGTSGLSSRSQVLLSGPQEGLW